MKRYILKTAALAFIVTSSFNSCSKKLDLQPTNDVTAAIAYSTPLGYKQNLGKVYGAFALTGNYGPGSGDIAGIDAGTSDFFRLFWKAQELSTDEAVVAWGDPGIQDFHLMNWGSTNPMLQGLYYRSLYQISVANDFLRQSTDDKVTSRGISGVDATNIKQYALEARFIRAYQYWVLMDLFGNPPFTTEADVVGTTIPKQTTRTELFNYIESELKAIEIPMIAAKTNEYGRADKAACQALLARLFLNAKVYTGTARNNDAITYAKKVIDAGYTPISNYTQLMLADNHTNTTENIFTINFDGLKTQNWGGTTFLTHASIGGSMNAADHGVDGGWYGIRTTKNPVNLYGDLSTNQDKRAMFYTNGQNKEINDLTSFNDGFAVTKYKNKTKAGASGSSLTWVDIDMPIFRIAEMYLIYAEGVTRGGTTGDIATATGYINLLRARAYGNTTGNITSGQLTTDFLLDERAKELFWEGFRRSDLIRYDKFVEATYLWPWKGGAKDGTSVSSFRKLYPIPSSDLTSNPNLKQNTGY